MSTDRGESETQTAIHDSEHKAQESQSISDRLLHNPVTEFVKHAVEERIVHAAWTAGVAEFGAAATAGAAGIVAGVALIVAEDPATDPHAGVDHSLMSHEPMVLSPDIASTDPDAHAPNMSVDPGAHHDPDFSIDPGALAPDMSIDPGAHHDPDFSIDPGALAPDMSIDPGAHHDPDFSIYPGGHDPGMSADPHAEHEANMSVDPHAAEHEANMSVDPHAHDVNMSVDHNFGQ